MAALVREEQVAVPTSDRATTMTSQARARILSPSRSYATRRVGAKPIDRSLVQAMLRPWRLAGLGEVRVFLVALPAAAKDRDAEEVQHRHGGIDEQAHPRCDLGHQDGDQVHEH